MFNKRNYVKVTEDTIFKPIRTYISDSLIAQLKDMSSATGMPISRLVAIAIDNELDAPVPFNYPCAIPDKVSDMSHANEAGKIIQILQRCPGGLFLESLVLIRRDVGIESRERLLGGVRELLNAELIELFTTRDAKAGYGTGSFTRVRLKGEPKVKVKRFKRIEDESQKYKRTIKDEDVSDE